MKHLWFTGHDGQKYIFFVCPKDAFFKRVSAVYVFLTADDGTGKVLYIGQTTDLSKSFSDHHKWDEATKLGFKYIATLPEEDSNLDFIARSLILSYNPQCNEQISR